MPDAGKSREQLREALVAGRRPTAELERTNQGLHHQLEERRRTEPTGASFAQLVEAAGQGCVLADLDGRLTYVNPHLCQMLGYRAEEMLGQHCFSYFPESFQSELQRASEIVRQKGHWMGEAPLVTRDGTQRTVLQNVFLLSNEAGEPVQVANVLTDITPRKAAEEALQQSHGQLQAIYDGLLDGLLVADIASMRFVAANTSLLRMLGYCEEELLRLTVHDLHPPEDVPRELARFQAAAEERLTALEKRRIRRKDGSFFFADMRGSRILFNGRPALIAVIRDISERIAAEQAVEQERQVLRNLLAACDRDRQWISYEIHDGLTQQLTGALMQFQSYVAFSGTDGSKGSTAFQRGMELLHASLAEARRLISGIRPPLLDDAGVVPALENLVLELNRQGGPQVEFFQAVTFGRLLPVLENSIYRIVHECLTNACRHSQSDRVQLELGEDPEHVTIQVQDGGVGFDPQEVGPHCFGLEGVRERARLLGGAFTLETRPGQGTVVAVRLPRIVRCPEALAQEELR